MKFLRSIAVLFLSVLCLSAYAQTDSLRFAGLDSQMESYFKALETENIATKISEVDFMLESSDSGEVRNHVALKIYDHYLNSKFMGDESVAVHVTDAWFTPGKARMDSDIDLMNAKIFAEFNRPTLLGKHAPSLRLQTPEGTEKEALGVVSDSLATGSRRLRVIYLYDTDCTRCRVETILLRSMFSQTDYPIDFIAIYTGDNRESWDKYRSENLNFTVNKARIFHYWDPEMNSDFQRKYGVLQTPKMLLLAKDGTVLGRNLDTPALMELLQMYAVEPDLDYGSDESLSLFASMIPENDPTMTADSVKAIADYIARKTLVETRDTLNYKQLAGDMLYYLAGKRGEAISYGSLYVADSLILDRPEIFNSENDTLKVVGLARIVHDVVSKAPAGSKLPSVLVHGTMIKGQSSREKDWNLARLRKGTYVLFHTTGCEICKAEKESASKLDVKVLLIDMDQIQAQGDGTFETLMDSFDLSSLPFELQVGKNSTVARKYTTLVGK